MGAINITRGLNYDTMAISSAALFGLQQVALQERTAEAIPRPHLKIRGQQRPGDWCGFVLGTFLSWLSSKQYLVKYRDKRQKVAAADPVPRPTKMRRSKAHMVVGIRITTRSDRIASAGLKPGLQVEDTGCEEKDPSPHSGPYHSDNGLITCPTKIKWQTPVEKVIMALLRQSSSGG